MFTRKTTTPKPWYPLSRRSWRNSAFPIPMRIGSGWTEMADSEPTHDNPRNTRNLPAVVPPGEVMRPVAENWLIRAIRTLFGWKPGSVRADLQVVLDASTPDEAGFSAVQRTMPRNILGLPERRIPAVMVHPPHLI